MNAMIQDNLIGSFTLGGMDWKILIDSDTCELNNSKWVTWYNRQVIYLKDFAGGNTLNYDVMERDLWAAIFNNIVTEHMDYNEEIYAEYMYSMSGLFYQAISTLTSKPGEWDGSYKLGGVEYIVTVNNRIGSEDGFFGRCNPNSKVIYMTTKNYSGINHTDDFIYQILFHEILHSINAELGKDATQVDTEKFINTLSIFLYEVYKTLKIKFPDETDT